MNRSDFVIRTLRYYVETGFSGTILLGDSSGPEHAAPTVAYLDRIRDRLNVTYLACPGLPDRETQHRLATMVETRYAALMGDDDFLVTQGLDACVAFLDANPGFTGANGRAWAFRVEPANPGDGEVYGEIDVFDAYPQPEFLQVAAAERYAAHMTNYRATLFTVHRTEVWRELFADVLMFDDRAFGSELVPTTLSPVLGRVKHLDRMYLLRQDHGRRYQLPQVDDWRAQPRWQANFERFRDLMVERIRAQDGGSVEDLKSFVEEAFTRGYLSRFAGAAPSVPPAALGPEPEIGVLRGFARSIPGARTAFRALASAYRELKQPSGILRQPEVAPPHFTSPLRDWLRPGSEHFASFDSVRRIVSNPTVQETAH